MVTRWSVALSVLVTCGLMVMLTSAESDKPAAGDRPAAAVTTQPATTKPSAKIEPLPGEKDKPFAVVQRARKAPQLDGKVDEGWGEPTLTGFFSEDTRKPVKPAVQTQVWLRYDDQNLYIVARMLEPNMGDLQSSATDRDGEVWQDDAFEVFLDPNSKADPSEYVQVVVNPIGTVADQRGSPDVSGDVAWDCKGCKIKTGKAKDAWVVEMAIPLESLGMKGPVVGKHWGANFARERKPGAAENSSWANLGPDWHQPDQFGHIAFEP